MKLGRNDLCPCRSGKKYKKCCSQKIEFVDVNIEKELLAVQMDFVRWATREYNTEIHEYMDTYFNKLNLSKEATETFNFFSHLWYFASVKKENQTILDLYIQTKPELLENERLLNIVQAWATIPPTPFIVKNWAPDHYVVIENAFTNETEWIKSLQDHHSERDSGIGLGLGSILPVEDSHVFFMTFFYVPEELETLREAIQEIKDVSEKSSSNTNEFFRESFMGVLEYIMLGTPLEEAIGMNLLNQDSQLNAQTKHSAATNQQEEAKVELNQSESEVASTKTEEPSIETTDNPIESEVLEAFIAYARGSQRNDAFLNIGLDLWTTYCLKENPTLRKPQVAAAALFYLVDTIKSEKSITQSKLAKDFFISATSISSRYKSLQKSLKDEISELEAVKETMI